jgi:tetratricopeptide (TPR) repeat protein
VVAQRLLPPNDDQVTSTMSVLAGVRYSLAKNAESERLHREALRLTRTRHGDSAAIVGTRLNALGTFLLYTGRPEQALPELERALRVQRRVRGDTHPSVVATLIAAGDAQRSLRRFAPAESTFRRALPLARTLFGASHPTIADILSRLGGTLSDQRKLEAADPMIRESIAMRIALLGVGHPDVQLARVELGRTLQLRARYAEAETLFTQALDGRRAALGPMSPAVAASMGDLGMLAKLQDRWPEVEKHYRASLPIWRAAGIEGEVMNSQGELGFALSKQNKLDEAERILLETVALRRTRFGDTHRSVGDGYEKLASLEMARGNFAKAESLSAAGLVIRRAAYGERSAGVAGHLQNLAFLREAVADTAGAIPFLRTSLGIYSELRPPTDINVVLVQRWLAVDLCTTGAAVEGDSLVRRALSVVPPDSTASLPLRLRAALGHCLARQRRFAEAEPLLVESERRLAAIPDVSSAHRSQLVSMLVGLYELWGKADQAALWRAKR